MPVPHALVSAYPDATGEKLGEIDVDPFPEAGFVPQNAAPGEYINVIQAIGEGDKMGRSRVQEITVFQLPDPLYIIELKGDTAVFFQ